ncbi:MAG TPA: rRNA maturation RNase YbeY [Patescibacteria group bacterium]|nr:rRNA maturation RNase YbeY [Patescibacteria group bacterium]
MNFVLISSESRYPVSRPRIKKTVLNYLKSLAIEDAEISVAIVGSRKIRSLNRKWRNLDEPTTVLTFALEEPRDISGILRIGDIVISYPEARLIAQEDNLSMDEAIDKLLIHGLSNLLGKHQSDDSISQIPASEFPGTGQ